MEVATNHDRLHSDHLAHNAATKITRHTTRARVHGMPVVREWCSPITSPITRRQHPAQLNEVACRAERAGAISSSWEPRCGASCFDSEDRAVGSFAERTKQEVLSAAPMEGFTAVRELPTDLYFARPPVSYRIAGSAITL
jgi:hypothetical protein